MVPSWLQYMADLVLLEGQFCILTVTPFCVLSSVFCLLQWVRRPFSLWSDVLVRHKKTPVEKKPLPFSSMAINANWRLCWVIRLLFLWLSYPVLLWTMTFSSISSFSFISWFKKYGSLRSFHDSDYIISFIQRVEMIPDLYSLSLGEKKKHHPDCLLLHFCGFFTILLSGLYYKRRDPLCFYFFFFSICPV